LMHENTFMKTCETAGLNRYLFQMANIREHCSWVHKDKKRATEKASRLVAAAVRRMNNNLLADYVVVCTGAPEAAAQALRCVERGGTVLFFAVPNEDIAVPIQDFWRDDITIKTTYGGAPADVIQAIALMQGGYIPCERMITHRLPLAETQKGFGLTAGATDSLKVVVRPQE